jgi:hypothetical protein
MVDVTPLPDDALLQVYAARSECYTDCFSAVIPREVSLAQFISAFYSTKLFGVERVILKYTVKRPSTAADISALALGKTERFAAWSVEAREPDQLLLCDMGGRTRSWLMVKPEGTGTRVFFGSAVTPPAGEKDLGFIFKALLGFHNLYSRALLRGAEKAL